MAESGPTRRSDDGPAQRGQQGPEAGRGGSASRGVPRQRAVREGKEGGERRVCGGGGVVAIGRERKGSGLMGVGRALGVGRLEVGMPGSAG